MPVLDAKALELDPQGTAFLLSVLRQTPSPKAPPEEASRLRQIRARVIRRPKELLPDPMQ